MDKSRRHELENSLFPVDATRDACAGTPVLGRLCWDACAGTPVSEPQHRLPTSDAGPETGSLFPKADGHSESLAFDDTA